MTGVLGEVQNGQRLEHREFSGGQEKIRLEVYREPKHEETDRSFRKLSTFTLNKMGCLWRILSRE